MLFKLGVAAVVLALGACTADTSRQHPPGSATAANANALAPRVVDLISPDIPPAVAGEAGWDFQRSTAVDLTGDGQPERVVLTARVEMYRGRPAWDDGQPWQVYVEAADGNRTYIYSQRLQLGTLTMRVSQSEQGEPVGIVLIEHLPDRLSLYEALYRGPGDVTVAERFQRELDPYGELASPQLP